MNLKKSLKVSFEFFPPKDQKMSQTLWKSIKRLEPLEPQFVSVTYGAMGSTRSRTHDLVKKIIKETNIQPAAHLTCVGSKVSEIEDIARNYWSDGIKHIVALRGDVPKNREGKEELNYATDLIKVLKRVNDFEITVSAYPEGHPDSKIKDQYKDFLKKKIDLGTTRAITQFFFGYKSFY